MQVLEYMKAKAGEGFDLGKANLAELQCRCEAHGCGCAA